MLESAEWTDFAFVMITRLIAYHGISYRDADGERELVHLLFGCIALFYGIWVLGETSSVCFSLFQRLGRGGGATEGSQKNTNFAGIFFLGDIDL